MRSANGFMKNRPTLVEFLTRQLPCKPQPQMYPALRQDRPNYPEECLHLPTRLRIVCIIGDRHSQAIEERLLCVSEITEVVDSHLSDHGFAAERPLRPWRLWTQLFKWHVSDEDTRTMEQFVGE
jgi:hypothetical protein